jgi:uncharacterized phage-associated protein
MEVIAMASLHDVAAAVLSRMGPITSMKLQKLIYYCQAWHLVRSGAPLFTERIEAWPQGPVVPTVFRDHRGHYSVDSWPRGNPDALAADETWTLGWVLSKYGSFSAESLSEMTHMELPWRVARGLSGPDERCSTEITQEQLKHYYSRQVASVEHAVAHAAASSSIEGVDLDDEWQDVLRGVATAPESADEAIRRVVAESALRD